MPRLSPSVPIWAQLPASWPETPRCDDAIYPDEYLEFWSDRYVERGYFYRGVTLMQFLANPLRYEHSELYPEPLPLLGRQYRIRSRLIEAEHIARPHWHEGEPLDLSWVDKQ